MTRSSFFPGFDGLMSLSRREGVDIRPTLLRVLTDLYVQASAHSADEERQFVELTSRLIDEVDDTTRAAVRARLAIYPATPFEILRKLGLRPIIADEHLPTPRAIPAAMLDPILAEPLSANPLFADPLEPAREDLTREDLAPPSTELSMQPKDAAELCDMFFRAGSNERAAMLHSLAGTPLKPAAKIPADRAAQAIEALQMAAFVADSESFMIELSESLILPARIAAQIVGDAGGEPLACAAKALGMPGAVFERVLLFLKPEIGQSVQSVFRLSRFYDNLNERAALIMLAAWRGAVMATPARPKHRPALHDDERQRARAATPSRLGGPPVSTPIARTGTDGFKR